jgi:hypothetical protein
MEWIGSMALDDTCPTKKRPSQTISTSIVWFIHRTSTAGLLCLMLSPSIQTDEFQKKIVNVTHPAAYWVMLVRKRLNQIVTIREKEKNSLAFELLDLSVFEDWEC